MNLLIWEKSKYVIFAHPPKITISVFWDSCFSSFLYETSVNTQKSTFTPITVMIYTKTTIHAKKRFAVFCTSPKKVYFSVLRLLMHLFVGLCKKATYHGNDSCGNVIFPGKHYAKFQTSLFVQYS